MTVHPGERLVGWFVVVALLILLGSLYLALRDVTEDKRHYILNLPTTYGLKQGDKVTMSGFNIGQITSLELREDDRVVIELTVDNPEHYRRIRRDAWAILTAPIPPVIAGSIEIVPGNAPEELPDTNPLRSDPPKTDLRAMAEDMADIIENMQNLAVQVNNRGAQVILGPDIAGNIEAANESVRNMVQRFEAITDDAAAISANFRSGETTLDELVWGSKPLVEVVFGPEVSARIIDISRGQSGIAEVFLGPVVWREVEAATQSWDSIYGSLMGVLGEANLIASDVRMSIAEIDPVLRLLARNTDQFDSMIRSSDLMLRDLRLVTGAVADGSEDIRLMLRQSRELIDHVEQLTDAARYHWLLAPYVTPTPAPSTGVGRGRPTNHYGE